MGLHAPYALRTIVEIVSDDGITGVSETHGGTGGGGRPAGGGRSGDRARSAPAGGAGARPIWPSGARWRSDLGAALWEGKLQSPPRTFGAIEVACLDLVGKALGRPVCDLLGGRVRDRVDFSAYLFYKHAGAGGRFGFRNRSVCRAGLGDRAGSARRSAPRRWSSRRRRW